MAAEEDAAAAAAPADPEAQQWRAEYVQRLVDWCVKEKGSTQEEAVAMAEEAADAQAKKRAKADAMLAKVRALCHCPACCNSPTATTEPSEGTDFYGQPVPPAMTFAELIGDDQMLVNTDRQPVHPSALAETGIVALYFSSDWCGPCKQFTPGLIKKYHELRRAAGASSFEVVYVSCDTSKEEFDRYYSTMPWLALEFSDADLISDGCFTSTLGTSQRLKERFGVIGIPSLVLFDGSSGELITANGRGALTSTCTIDSLRNFELQLYSERSRVLSMVRDMPDTPSSDAHMGCGTLRKMRTSTYECTICCGAGTGWAVQCDACRWVGHPLCACPDPTLRKEQTRPWAFTSASYGMRREQEYIESWGMAWLNKEQPPGLTTLAEAAAWVQWRNPKALGFVCAEIDGGFSIASFTKEGRRGAAHDSMPLYVYTATQQTEAALSEAESKQRAGWEAFRLAREEEAAATAALVAGLPATLTSDKHEHLLEKLESVYAGDYVCDVCEKLGEGWVYHCKECGWDAHPSCLCCEEGVPPSEPEPEPE